MMRCAWLTLGLGLIPISLTVAVEAAETRLPLQVLYIGNTESGRAAQFVGFLRTHFESVDQANRANFDPKSARNYDVVLLDWSQSDKADRTISPLGDRDAWTAPTVLLGSAGLLLAGPWQIIGGVG